MPLQRRMPKVGFRSAMKRDARRSAPARAGAGVEAPVIDLAALQGGEHRLGGTPSSAKVVLSGKLEKAVTLKGIGVTKGARAAIEAAGGKVEA